MSNSTTEASSLAARPKKRRNDEALTEKKALASKKSHPLAELKATARRVHRPSFSEWKKEYKWVLVVVLGSVLTIMAVDWLALLGRDALLGILPNSGGGTVETIFLVVYVLCGLLTLGSVLLLRGSTGGLSSLLGSSVEYGAMSTAGFEQKITRFMVTMAVTFVLMTLFSPLFLS